MKPILTLALMGLSTVAHAGTDIYPLTYEAFEVSVPHMDLENCPAGLQIENSFCRATLNHEELHIFAFSYDGDSPLVGFKTYSAEGIEALLK